MKPTDITGPVVLSKEVNYMTITVYSNYYFRWSCWEGEADFSKFSVDEFDNVTWNIERSSKSTLTPDDTAHRFLIEAHNMILLEREIEKFLTEDV